MTFATLTRNLTLLFETDPEKMLLKIVMESISDSKILLNLSSEIIIGRGGMRVLKHLNRHVWSQMNNPVNLPEFAIYRNLFDCTIKHLVNLLQLALMFATGQKNPTLFKILGSEQTPFLMQHCEHCPEK